VLTFAIIASVGRWGIVARSDACSGAVTTGNRARAPRAPDRPAAVNYQRNINRQSTIYILLFANKRVPMYNGHTKLRMILIILYP